MTGPDDPLEGFERRLPASVSGWDWDAGATSPLADGGDGATSSSTSGATGGSATAAGVRDGFAIDEPQRYEDGGLLGRGGMGEVRASLDRRLGRLVARKTVDVDPAQRSAATSLLEREAQLTARLDHPGIVPVYDAGVGADGRRYYTMRLVTGGTLADAIAEAGSRAAQVRLLRSVLAAAQAVAFAHDRGIVHRDLKPQNILIGDFGQTQVADWGLALDLQEPHGGGQRVGTPGFQAPEVRDGAAADRRADVYSLGCVLGAVMAGRDAAAGLGTALPNQASPGQASPGQASPGQVSPTHAHWPAEVRAILARSTDPAPGHRYPDARALAADLEAYLDGRLVGAYDYSPLETLQRFARAWRAPLVVAGVGLCALALLGALAWQRTREERDRAIVAEAETRSALQVADRSLAAAWLAAAERRFEIGLWPEAEVLASQALLRAESSVARGILAGVRAPTRLRRATTTPRPAGCTDAQISARGEWLLCRDADSVSLWSLPKQEGGALGRVWSVPLRCQSMALAQDSVLVTVDRVVEVRSLLDGSRLRSEPAGMGGSGWQLAPDARTVVRVAGGIVTIHRPRSEAVELAICATGTVMVATVDRVVANGRNSPASEGFTDAQEALALCTDGTAVRIDLLLARVLARQPTDLGPLHRGASAAWLGTDEGAYVGCHDGYLAALDWPQLGAPRWARNAGVGQVHAIERRGDRLVVVGEVGGATVWDARSGALQARLPVVAGTTVRLASPMELWTVGGDVQRWQLPAELRPALMRLGTRDDGMTAVAMSPDGASIALADSVGLLQVLGLDDAAPALTTRAEGNLLKSVSWSTDGQRLSAVGMLPDLLAFDAKARFSPLLQKASGARRRIADVAGGHRLALSYNGGIDALTGDGTTLATITPTAPSTPFLDLAMQGDGLVGCAVDGVGGVWALDAATGAAATGAAANSAAATGAAATGAAATLPVLARSIGSFAGAEVCVPTADGLRVVVARPGELVSLPVNGAATGGTTPPALQTGGERIHDVALSKDGRWLALAELSGVVRVLSWPDGREVALLRGHRQRVASIAFSPDDSLLVSASWDGSARLWSVDAFAADPSVLAASARSFWPETNPTGP